MITDESTIIEKYSEQKIPTADELPNLDVLMITDEKQIGSAIAYIRGKF